MSAVLLLGTPAAVAAQLLPCTSVAPEVRDYIRSRGACRDVKAAPRPRAAAKPKPVAPVVPVPTVPAVDPPESTAVRTEAEASPPSAASAPPVEPPAATAAPLPVPVPVPVPAPEPAASVVPVAPPAPEPPAAPVLLPAARSSLPLPFPTIAALIFGAGLVVGLLAGFMLKRRRPSHGTTNLVDSAPPVPVATAAPPDIRFAAWLVPVATTIDLAPGPGVRKFPSSEQAAAMLEQVRLRAPIEVDGDDIEWVLCERIGGKAVSAQVRDRLQGFAAECAAAELNRALDVDILDVLSQGWVELPAMHEAVQLSAVTRGPAVLVDVDTRHTITSTAHVVLATHVAERALPPLEMLLEIVVDVDGATVAARDGGIELFDIGEATVLARLTVDGTLIGEHRTEILHTSRGPSGQRQPAPERPASVDIPI